MQIKRIYPYVETDDLHASRSFYTEVFGLRVLMEAPVMGLQAPDVASVQVIVCPRGFEAPQPNFGIDVGDPGSWGRRTTRCVTAGLSFGWCFPYGLGAVSR